MKKIFLDWLPHKILEQMHTVDLICNTDDEIIRIITNDGRTADKWDEAKMNVGHRRSNTETRRDTQVTCCFGKESKFDKLQQFKKPFQGQCNTQYKQSSKGYKMTNEANKTYAQQREGIDKYELDRRKAAG